MTLAGLEQPAEILVDQWGVPHIYAQTHYDAFFVQGFNAARDRLWQIDTWRRRGLGQLAEVLGKPFVSQDRAARLFLYRGDLYREWLAYGSDAKRIAEAFVAGINAYVDQVERGTAPLPPEFKLLGYAPSKWQAEDIVRIRSNGLWRNATREVERARLLCRGNAAVAQAWKVLEPSHTATVPEGLDPCSVPTGVLDSYLLAKAAVDFTPLEQRIAAVRRRDLSHHIGSNNWVVAPERTVTGRPILADDPHRTHAVPSLRYVAHLVAPGLNVIGAGEPALPGISIGHNEKIAFGLTIFPIDQEDLYFYRKRKDGYLYQGRTEPITEVRETLRVKNGAPEEITLRFTRHGPVVFEEDNRLWAVRAAWLEPGMAPYFGSVEYMRAGNWRQFVAALNRWGAPSENQVYADTDGNIGYKPAGLFPKRTNWDGLLPVPGDGRFEWQGYFDMDVLPEEYNPKRGFTGSANSMNLPADYPIERYQIGYEWSAPFRYRRLWEVLEQQPEHTLEQSKALQRDYHSVLARELLTSIEELDSLGKAGAMLAEWDHTLSAHSAAAALWNVWYHRHLVPTLGSKLTKGDALQSLDSLTVLELIQQPAQQPLIASTLTSAWAETERLLGKDSGQWQWGDLHRIVFKHPLLTQSAGPLRDALRIQDYPRGGSEFTTNNTSFDPKNFRVRSGASFRMVLDVGNWSAARMTNAPGQSGDPNSPFYDNLLQDWANEKDFPLLWERKAVEEHLVQHWRLTPLAATP